MSGIGDDGNSNRLSSTQSITNTTPSSTSSGDSFSASELIHYAKQLGLEVPRDKDLMWIARRGYRAPLPSGWRACQSRQGRTYYYNETTGESRWIRPASPEWAAMVVAERNIRRATPIGNGTTIPPPSTPVGMTPPIMTYSTSSNGATQPLPISAMATPLSIHPSATVVVPSSPHQHPIAMSTPTNVRPRPPLLAAPLATAGYSMSLPPSPHSTSLVNSRTNSRRGSMETIPARLAGTPGSNGHGGSFTFNGAAAASSASSSSLSTPSMASMSMSTPTATPAVASTTGRPTNMRHTAPATTMTPIPPSHVRPPPPQTPATSASWWQDELPKLSLHHQIVLNRLRLMMSVIRIQRMYRRFKERTKDTLRRRVASEKAATESDMALRLRSGRTSRRSSLGRDLAAALMVGPDGHMLPVPRAPLPGTIISVPAHGHGHGSGTSSPNPSIPPQNRYPNTDATNGLAISTDVHDGNQARALTPKRRAQSIHGIPASVLAAVSPASAARQAALLLQQQQQQSNGVAGAFNMAATTAAPSSVTAPSSPTHGSSEKAALRRQRTLTKMREIQQRFSTIKALAGDTTPGLTSSAPPAAATSASTTSATNTSITAAGAPSNGPGTGISPNGTRADVRQRIGRRAHSPDHPPPSFSSSASGMSRSSAPAGLLGIPPPVSARVTLAMTPAQRVEFEKNIRFIRLITRIQRRIRAARVAAQAKLKQRIEASRSATLLDFEWRKIDGDRPVGRTATLVRPSSHNALLAPGNGNGSNRVSPNGTPYISPNHSPRPPTRALSTSTPASNNVSGGSTPANGGSPQLSATAATTTRRPRHLTLLMTAEDQAQLSHNLKFMRLLVRLQRHVRAKHIAAKQRLKAKLESERERNMAEFERKLAMIKMEGITGVTSRQGRSHRRVQSFHPSTFATPPNMSVTQPGQPVSGLLPVGSVTPGPSLYSTYNPTTSSVASSSSAAGGGHNRSATMVAGQVLPHMHTGTPAWGTMTSPHHGMVTPPPPAGMSITVNESASTSMISMTPNPSAVSRPTSSSHHHAAAAPQSSHHAFVPMTPQPWPSSSTIATHAGSISTGPVGSTAIAGRRFPRPTPLIPTSSHSSTVASSSSSASRPARAP